MCCKSWFHNYVGVLDMLVKALLFFPGLCLCVLLNVWPSFFIYSFVICLMCHSMTHFPAQMTGSGTMINLQRTRC